jgi:hypothetical protein
MHPETPWGVSGALALKRTRPPAGYEVIIEDHADVTIEIERRAGRTVAERFEPLFEKQWRTAAATSLGVLWPTQPMEGAVDATKALAIRLDVCGTADGLTPQAVLSLDGLVKELLPFATGSTNAVRTTEIYKAFKARSDTQAAGDISTDAQSQLLLSTTYQTLLTDVGACGTDYRRNGQGPHEGRACRWHSFPAWHCVARSLLEGAQRRAYGSHPAIVLRLRLRHARVHACRSRLRTPANRLSGRLRTPARTASSAGEC